MSTLNHNLCVAYAQKYGVDCAILISHFQFWIEQNQAMGRNFHDGRTWMYQTQNEIAAVYPYWTRDQVQYLLQKLVDFDVLIKGNYNKTQMDKTTWYAFKDEKMFTKVEKSTIDGGKVHNGRWKSPQAIPDTKQLCNQIKQQQQTPSAAVVQSKKKIQAKPEIHECFKKLDIPEDRKIALSNKCTANEAEDALAWANAQTNFTKGFLAALTYAVNRKLKIEEILSPIEKVKKMFKNGEKYEGATCYIDQKSIAFERGMKHEQVKFDMYFKWEKLVTLCNSFGIKINN
jgi:hypothetical protein